MKNNTKNNFQRVNAKYMERMYKIYNKAGTGKQLDDKFIELKNIERI